MNLKLYIITLSLLLLQTGCTEQYVPQPNQVAFATSLWDATYLLGNDEEHITIYQLGTTDSDVDHYIKFHIDYERSTAIENIDFEFPDGDSALIPKKKYIGYIKIHRLFEGTLQDPRLVLVLDGNEAIQPKSGMDRCIVNL